MNSRDIIDEIIVKCSKSQIKQRLSKYSFEEKKEKLNGKLNPLEEEEYNFYTDKVRNMKDILEKIDEYPDDERIRIPDLRFEGFKNKDSLLSYINERIDRYNEKIFQYEKRIFTDYSINRYPIPEFDKSIYKLDDNGDRAGISNSLGDYERREVEKQEMREYSDFEKESLRSWWGNGHIDINRSLYGDLYDYEKEDKEFMSNLARTKRGITSAINKSEGLSEPMVMFHGGRFNIHLNPGDHITFKGYTSLSFNKKSAEGFSYRHLELGKALYLCYTPAQLKGVCGNADNVGNFQGTEHEYLTNKGLGATIINIDYENNIVEVLIDED